MDEHFSLGFSLAPGIGPKGFQNLTRILGSPSAAWEGNEADLKKAGVGKINFSKFDKFRKTFNHKVYFEKMAMANIKYIPYGDKYYSESLQKIESPPIGLFIKGNKNLLLEKNNIAVVGARKITSYGREVTEQIVRDLVCNYIVITSGMALGVDGVAHQAAIEGKGATIAVLGCGVDCPYPRENEKLYEEILDSNGLVISEYPLGMQPNKGTFPARNRIIAGLSFAVLITEAAEDSGSLITAEYSLEQGKKVFAVPGPITSKMSKGSLKLLKQGAVLVSSSKDIISELGIMNHESWKNKKTSQKLKKLKLSTSERKVYEVLQNEERTIDEIARLTKIKPGQLSIILSEMELSGLVKSNGGKWSIKY